MRMEALNGNSSILGWRFYTGMEASVYAWMEALYEDGGLSVIGKPWCSSLDP